jgi:hypothetical protein
MCDEHPNTATGLKVLNVGFGLGIVGVPHVFCNAVELTYVFRSIRTSRHYPFRL